MIRMKLNLLRLVATAMLAVSCAASCQADMITTLFGANNGQSGNMFDINVLAPGGIQIQGFDLNLGTGNWDINIYTRDGSYFGNETNPGAWTLHDSITGLTSAGFNNPTFWDFNDLTVGSGTQAFYVEVTNGFGLRYTNGSSEGSVYVDNGVLQILEGTGNQAGFGNQFRPRIWNGTIYYNQVPEPGALTVLAIVLCAVCTRRWRR